MRKEHDLLGEKLIPDDAYYGVQSARAMENFHISGVPLSQYPDLIRALAMVKLAAARANYDCKQFSKEILTGIEKACQELMDGKLHDQFAVDMIQGGAGTSTNMAANEVIANRALELMGHKKGQYEFCDPHNHVNCAQSTNDAYPTSLHVAVFLLNEKLVAELRKLVAAFRKKGTEFGDVIKMGRTQLQDAVPMTLGQEFNAFGESLENEVTASGARREHSVRSEHGRHGDRNWPQRSRRIRRALCEAPGPGHRQADRVGAGPGRGHAGHAAVRAVLLCS